MAEEALSVYNQEYESSTNSTSEKVYDEELNDYYFESDNFALKENPDYCNLLKSLAILESQRARAVQDLDHLVEARQIALADPVGFVEKLQKNVDLNLPKSQRICELPLIDWDKYTTKLSLLPHRHMTRNKKVNFTTPAPNLGNCSSFDNSSPSSSSSNLRNSETECLLYQIPVVRGRVFSSDKPQSFNQLWTDEEQIRLQKLLVEFPEEDVEARRYEKISNALGNRTPLQVASRVQKYFIKLAKAGFPVPGRIPNVNSYSKRNGPHRKHRLLFNRSTFFASHEPPVYMSEYDDDCSMSWSNSNTDEDSQWNIDNDLDSMGGFLPRELNTTQDFKDYIYRKNQKNNQSGRSSSQFRKDDISKCIVCNCDLIVGNRWHCIDCPPTTNLNFCNKCYTSDYESSTHRSNHRLESIFDDPDSQMDDDYTCNSFGEGYYNYLDPNYVSKK